MEVVARPARSRWRSPTRCHCGLLPAGSSQVRSLPTIVKPLQYPEYWYTTAAFMERTVPHGERVVVLPWHLYQPLRATEGRLAANPAPVFFPGRLTAPRNLEIPGRATEIVSRYDRIGLAVRRERSSPCALARTLRSLRIRWALVLDGAESAETISRLRACGYSLVEGRAGIHRRPPRSAPGCRVIVPRSGDAIPLRGGVLNEPKRRRS